MTYEELKKIIESKSYDGYLNHFAMDERVNSYLSKNPIKYMLQDMFPENFIMASTRAWYDIGLYFGSKFFPISIKITNGDKTDNVGSKKGMFYCMTGINLDEQEGREKIIRYKSFPDFNINLVANYNPNTEADYYYLVLFKDTRRILFTSMKHLRIVEPNGHNLPFQCRWSDNMTDAQRCSNLQCQYLMDTYLESFQQRARGLIELYRWNQMT